MITEVLLDELLCEGLMPDDAAEDVDTEAPSLAEGVDVWKAAVDGAVDCSLWGVACCCVAKTMAGTPTPVSTPMLIKPTRFRGVSERDTNGPTILRARRWGFDRMRFCFW